ncbi:MAG: aconitate hydratase [Spirochaetales bacterium]|nr:aconitate hydratase [Spirochaetales bacterium]
MKEVATTPELVRGVYNKSRENLDIIRKRLNRPMGLAEKVLFSHLIDPEGQDLERGVSFLNLQPDRVAMQDATAQMALLQFMLSGRNESAVPATVHCDHLIRAYQGNEKDLAAARETNSEIYDFLSSAASRYNIGFWEPGAGIIHQIILENYAFPGGLMIGTDSHTPNAGGLGMTACGVGGADASDVMAGLAWEVKNPNIIGVKLTGTMSGWTSPKDVIIKLLSILTVKGGTNCIIEYFGEGCESISCTGKGTITNMGAELGATCSLFPYDGRMADYLRKTGREELASLADENGELLKADDEAMASPEAYYDRVIEIDLTALEPQIAGPHSPDAVTPLSEMKEKGKREGWPNNLTAALIGSCTNSSYEDIDRATSLMKQALAHGIKPALPLMVSPGSLLVKDTLKRDGQMDILEEGGAIVLSNSCGPCIGQWKRDDIAKGDRNSIVNSFNRNFRARNDGNPETLSFIASPEMVTAMGIAGKLDFDPYKDKITTPSGEEILLEPPRGLELPEKDFLSMGKGYIEPKGARVDVRVSPASDRLQLLTPFSAWDGTNYANMPVLCKARGKCTTDHISPAGVWLKYRGHLDNISDNMLIGAVNAFTGETGKGKNVVSGEQGLGFSKIARQYKEEKLSWIIIGDENYGEGSSREHAAMSPRFLGCAVVLVKSFARIHETNLKKQGVLALTFAHKDDYERIGEEDRLALAGLEDFAPGKSLEIILNHSDGREERFPVEHSYNEEQIGWFKAGSALNVLRKK